MCKNTRPSPETATRQRPQTHIRLNNCTHPSSRDDSNLQDRILLPSWPYQKDLIVGRNDLLHVFSNQDVHDILILPSSKEVPDISHHRKLKQVLTSHSKPQPFKLGSIQSTTTPYPTSTHSGPAGIAMIQCPNPFYMLPTFLAHTALAIQTAAQPFAKGNPAAAANSSLGSNTHTHNTHPYRPRVFRN